MRTNVKGELVPLSQLEDLRDIKKIKKVNNNNNNKQLFGFHFLGN